jgi:hypothetical protein
MAVISVAVLGVGLSGCKADPASYELDDQSGTLCPRDEPYLTLSGNIVARFPLEPGQISLVSFVAKDTEGHECPSKDFIDMKTEYGPMLRIEVDARGKVGTLTAKGFIIYKGHPYAIRAVWSLRDPVRREWHLDSCDIVPD